MTSQQQNMYITESNNEWRGHHNSIIEWLGTCQKLPGGEGGVERGRVLFFQPFKRVGH
jgi:hypothetical protein